METLPHPVINQQMHCFTIGEQVPYFEADSTLGRVKLEDYQEQWLVFFTYPADFTAVCATEVVAFGKLHQQFKDIGCQVVALSIDSVGSHIPWLQTIEDWLGEQIEYPIIGDYDGRIAREYGVYIPNGNQAASIRCTFIIDTHQILRALLMYPAEVGRNTEEILRLVQALQLSDKLGKSTPANWQLGDELLRVEGSN